MRRNSKKNLVIIAIITFLSIIGISYAFFNYYMLSSENMQLITGDVYLRLNEGIEQISLINAFPETALEARARDDNYITFSIVGRNTTTNKDIHYEIDLNDGDEVEGRTRLNDGDLRFDLIEFIGEEEVYVVSNESFASFDAEKIWVDYVARNTKENVERTYMLRMWVSEDVLISDTDANASYTTGEYANSYATVRVSVYGDFNEKATDAACFSTRDVYGNMQYDTVTYTLNKSTDAVDTCVDYLKNKSSIFSKGDYSDDKDGYQSFCEGTGTVAEDFLTLEDLLKFASDKNLDRLVDGLTTLSSQSITNTSSLDDLHDMVDYFIENDVIENYQVKTKYYSLSEDSEKIKTCSSYIGQSTEDMLVELFDKIPGGIASGYSEDSIRDEGLGEQLSKMYGEQICSSVELVQYLQTLFDLFEVGDLDYLKEEGILIEDDELKYLGLSITNYDSSCGEQCFIPSTIDGKKVVQIGFEALPLTNALGYKGLTKVVIPDGVKYIGANSFNGNDLRTVVIPGTVETIGASAFSGNELTYVYLKEGVKNIESNAFNGNLLTSIKLPESLETIAGAFKNNKLTSIIFPEGAIKITDGAFNGNQLKEEDAYIYQRVDNDNDGVAEIDTTTLVSYGGTKKEIIVPETVTNIDDGAFYDLDLTSVKIHSGVTRIGDTAFYSNVLSSVTLPSGLKELGVGAFAYNRLTTIEIPSGITKISDTAFANNSLSSITLPFGITEIGNGAFQYNQFRTFTIPSTVTKIGSNAFTNNYLTSISIPSAVKSIGSSAFQYNSSLSSVTFQSSLENIGTSAFQNCALTSVTIPESVTSIGGNAFANNQITTATLPSGLTKISSGLFKQNRLTSIQIPANVTSIGSSAFEQNSLTSVVIPAKVTTIGANAFQINSLKTVTIPESVTEIGNYAFSYNQIESAVIPSKVTVINNYIFAGNRLTSVSIPDGVTSIGNSAFSNNLLTSVDIPEGVTSIGTCTFCSNQLTGVTIPDGVTTLSNNIFANNLLQSITIPAGVTSIGDLAFSNNKLTSVNIPSKVTSIGSRAFYNNLITNITIPNNVVSLGGGVLNLNQLNESNAYFYKRSDTNEDGVAEIDTTTIVSYGGTNKDLTIASSVTKLDNYSLYDLDLTSVSLPSNLTTIGSSALQANLLTEITIPNSVTSMGSSALSGNRLTTVTLSNNLTTLSSNVLYNNLLTSLTIPSSVTSIESYALGYNQLTSLNIPNTVTNIGQSAFAGNNKLTAISVGNNIQTLGTGAFSGLTNVTITFDKTCAEVRSINGYYPWLETYSPYTKTGSTIKSTNGEVCNSY